MLQSDRVATAASMLPKMLHLIKAGNDADGNYNGDGENERSVKRLSAAVVSHEIEGSLLACVTHTYDSSALEDIGEEDGEEPTRVFISTTLESTKCLK